LFADLLHSLTATARRSFVTWGGNVVRIRRHYASPVHARATTESDTTDPYMSRSATAAAGSTSNALIRNTEVRPNAPAVRPNIGLASPSARSRNAVYVPIATPRFCGGARR